MEIIRHHFHSIDSTNNCAKRNHHLFDPEKITLITADEQTAGRGRARRQWNSPANQNIYATFCFFLPKGTKISNLSLVLAISAVKMVESCGFKAQLKWPNDLMLKGNKVGGVLCETVISESHICIINGIGVNINMPEQSLQQIDTPATSLLVEGGGVSIEIEPLVERLENIFLEDLQLFIKDGFPPFLPTFKELLTHYPLQKIRFNDHINVWEGLFHSINDDGSLNLQLEPNKEIKSFFAGNIL